MKYIIFFFLILFISLETPAAIITGGVEYSVTQAKNEVISQKPSGINKNLIRMHLFDNNKNENITKLLQGYTNLADRTLAYFSDGSYAINYKDDELHVFYYGNDGLLTHIEERTDSKYPYKSYKYKLSGEIENMSYRTSEEETFIFNKDGKLLAHWIGKNCYDENNQIIMTRKILK